MNLSESTQNRLSRIGLEFLTEFLAAEVRLRPENLEALAELGHSLTRLGRHEEGLAVDHQLVQLAPDNSTVHYNLACSLALLGRLSESLDALELAVDLGYDDAEHLIMDDDLLPLREERRFHALVRALRAQRSPVR